MKSFHFYVFPFKQLIGCIEALVQDKCPLDLIIYASSLLKHTKDSDNSITRQMAVDIYISRQRSRG